MNAATAWPNKTAMEPSAPKSHMCELLPTPVIPSRLAEFLRGYLAPKFHYLMHGFTFGFSIRHMGSPNTKESPNLKTAIDMPDMVSSKIMAELSKQRLLGPLERPPWDTYVVSPIGLCPKKTPGEYRLIHHLSFPKWFFC